MTQSSLAEATGIPQPYLSRIEADLKTPTDFEVGSLTKALSINPRLLSLDIPLFGDQSVLDFYFRSSSMARRKSLRSVTAHLELLAVYILQALEHVDLVPPRSIPSISIRQSGEGPWEAAEELRTQWRLPVGPIPDLISVIESTGIVVVPYNLKDEKIDAVTVHRPGSQPIIFVDLTRPVDRVRHSLAHELGHIVIHAQGGIDGERDIELEADQFASAFLVPKSTLERQLGDYSTFNDLLGLKHIWRVSIKSLIVRGKEYGLLSESKSLSFYKIHSYRGYNKHEPGMLSPERPGLIYTILRSFIEELEYTPVELSDLMRCSENELSDLMSGRTEIRLDKAGAATKGVRIVLE